VLAQRVGAVAAAHDALVLALVARLGDVLDAERLDRAVAEDRGYEVEVRSDVGELLVRVPLALPLEELLDRDALCTRPRRQRLGARVAGKNECLGLAVSASVKGVAGKS
jgi:hypothetical protein